MAVVQAVSVLDEEDRMDDAITVSRVGDALVVGRPSVDGAAVALAGALVGEVGRTAVVVGDSAAAAMTRLDPWVVADLAERIDPAVGGVRVFAPRWGAVGPDGAPPPARLLADRLGVEVVAPDGDLVACAGGAVFVPGRGAGWVSYRPGRSRVRTGPRHPAPWWQPLLPDDLGEHVTQVPCGLWLHPPGPPGGAAPQEPAGDRLAVVVGSPGTQAPPAAVVAAVVRALPPEVRDGLVLTCHGDAGALRDELGLPAEPGGDAPDVDETDRDRPRPRVVEPSPPPRGAVVVSADGRVLPADPILAQPPTRADNHPTAASAGLAPAEGHVLPPPQVAAVPWQVRSPAGYRGQVPATPGHGRALPHPPLAAVVSPVPSSRDSGPAAVPAGPLPAMAPAHGAALAASAPGVPLPGPSGARSGPDAAPAARQARSSGPARARGESAAAAADGVVLPAGTSAPTGGREPAPPADAPSTEVPARRALPAVAPAMAVPEQSGEVAPSTAALPQAASREPAAGVRRAPGEDRAPTAVALVAATQAPATAAPAGGRAPIEVPADVHSTAEQRQRVRAALGTRYDIAVRAVTRLLSERPGLRAGNADQQALVTELAVVHVFADDPGARYDIDFHSCLAGGLRRLPTARGVVLRGIPGDAGVRIGDLLRLQAPVVALPARSARPVGPAEALIWTTTARALDGLGGDGGEVVLPGHVRLRVLAMADSRVLLTEDGAPADAALARLRAAADARAAVQTAEPATDRWFGALPAA